MRIAALSAAVLAVAAIACTSARADFDGNVNFFLGAKSLNSNDWSPNDNQVAFGAVMSFGMKDWPVQIAGDVLVSVDETTNGTVKTTGATFEFDPGIRWLILKKGTVVPYIGGGVGIIGGAAKVENNFVSVDAADASLGVWTDAGVFFRLGSNFNIGLDLRYSTADIDLDFGGGVVAQNVNAGGFSFGMLMGFSF
jgi:outer membrane protein W